MFTKSIVTAAVLACSVLAISANADELLTDTSSDILTWDAPLGTTDLVDPIAEDYFEELSRNQAPSVTETSLESNVAVPEPSTLLLLGVGGFLLTRRRRR